MDPPLSRVAQPRYHTRKTGKQFQRFFGPKHRLDKFKHGMLFTIRESRPKRIDTHTRLGIVLAKNQAA